MLKTKRIGLIVTSEEKDWVVQLAKLEGGLSQASLIRRLIHKAAEQKCLIALSKENNSTKEKVYEQPPLESK